MEDEGAGAGAKYHPAVGQKHAIRVAVCPSQRRTTILTVPLVALRADQIRQVQGPNTNHLERTLGERREASLVFGSVEAACSPEFEQYATSLIERQKLDYIVVYECHLTVVAADYRRKLTDLAHL